VSGKRTFVILDAHGEYRSLLDHFPPDELVWVEPDDVGLNPFEVPSFADGTPSMAPDKWVGHLKEWMRKNWLNDPSVNFFAECVLGLYRARGVFEGSGDFPCLSDVIEAVENLYVQRNSDAARAREKLLDRLTAMRFMLPGLDVRRSRDIHELFWRRSVIIHLRDLGDLAMPLFFEFLVVLFSVAFEAEEEGGPAQHLLVMEEASAYLGGQLNKRTADLKESRGVSVLRSLRKAGFCGCVVSQLVSDVDPAVTGNLTSMFCFRLTRNQCMNQAASGLGMEHWQRCEVGILPPREAIARVSAWPGPIHVAVADAGDTFAGRGMSCEEARVRSRPVLEKIPFVPRPPNAKPESGTGPLERAGSPVPARRPRPKCAACATMGLTLGRDEHRLLADICEKPDSLTTERADRLGMSREEESARRTPLKTMGLVVKSATVGNRRLLVEPGAKGRQWASLHGISIPKGHGSVAHQCTRRISEEQVCLAFPGTSVLHVGAGQPEGTRLDGIFLLPGDEGYRVALQAVFAHNPKGEAVNLLKLCGERPRSQADTRERNGGGWIDLVLSVACNKRVQKSVENAVKKLNGGRVPSKLVFLDVESLLDPTYDITWILERPT